MKITEWRGVERLVYAKVTQDDAEAFVTGTVKPLAGVAEVSRSTESSSETHYYDNMPAIVITATGSDMVTINTSAIEFDTLADITGQTYDDATGMFVEQGERNPGYYALGYETKKTDGTKVYVWRLKGMFNIPDTTNSTENDGTDANGQELTYTGISTTHKFEYNNQAAKAVNIDTSVNESFTADTFFGSVQTPDTIAGGGVTSYDVTNTLSHVVNSNAAVSINDGSAYLAALTAETGYTIDTVEITMGGTDITGTAYNSDNGVIYVTNVTGALVITATAIVSGG